MTSPLNPEAASAYVAHCLRLNPMWQTDEVLSARADAFRIGSEQRSTYELAAEEARRRTELRDKVYRIRDSVWTLPLEKLRAELSALSLEGEPDLQALAGRLRTIANARTQLPALTQDKRFDGDFFDCLKQVLSGGPRESAAMRERVVASFQDKTLRKRGVKMIKLLKREVPELYELEEPWLLGLGKQRRRESGNAVPNVTVDTGGWFSGNWWWWIIGFALLRGLIRLASSGGDG